MNGRTVYRSFVVLTAKLGKRDLEPGDWTEIARTETEQEAHAIARRVRSNDVVARIVEVAELAIIINEPQATSKCVSRGGPHSFSAN